MNLPLMALLAVLLLAIWLFIRVRRITDDDKPAPASGSESGNSTYHAASLKISGKGCDAAMAMTGRRFLSTAAPKLPLPDCDVLDCNCRFVHHKDRRSGKDRRSPFGPSGVCGATGRHELEKRQGPDRRKSDNDEIF